MTDKTPRSDHVHIREVDGLPSVILSAELHASVGPICRAFGNRVQFEIEHCGRPLDDAPAILGVAADKIDDWREARGLPTTRSGTYQHSMGIKAAPVPDGLEIVHYAAKELAASRGSGFTLTEGEAEYPASKQAMDEVQLVLEAAARARRK